MEILPMEQSPGAKGNISARTAVRSKIVQSKSVSEILLSIPLQNPEVFMGKDAEELSQLAAQFEREGNTEARFSALRLILLSQLEALSHDMIDESPVAETAEQLVRITNSVAMQYLDQDDFVTSGQLLTLARGVASSKQCPFEPLARARLRAVTCNNLGCYYRRCGKHHTALKFLHRSLELEQVIPNAANPASTLLNLCVTLSEINRHEEALDYATRACSMLHRQLVSLSNDEADDVDDGPNPQRIADAASLFSVALHNRAVQQEFLEEWDDAVVSYEAAVDVIETNLSVDHPLYHVVTRALNDCRVKAEERKEKLEERAKVKEKLRNLRGHGKKTKNASAGAENDSAEEDRSETLSPKSPRPRHTRVPPPRKTGKSRSPQRLARKPVPQAVFRDKRLMKIYSTYGAVSPRVRSDLFGPDVFGEALEDPQSPHTHPHLQGLSGRQASTTLIDDVDTQSHHVHEVHSQGRLRHGGVIRTPPVAHTHASEIHGGVARTHPAPHTHPSEITPHPPSGSPPTLDGDAGDVMEMARQFLRGQDSGVLGHGPQAPGAAAEATLPPPRVAFAGNMQAGAQAAHAPSHEPIHLPPIASAMLPSSRGSDHVSVRSAISAGTPPSSRRTANSLGDSLGHTGPPTVGPTDSPRTAVRKASASDSHRSTSGQATQRLPGVKGAAPALPRPHPPVDPQPAAPPHPPQPASPRASQPSPATSVPVSPSVGTPSPPSPAVSSKAPAEGEVPTSANSMVSGGASTHQPNSMVSRGSSVQQPNSMVSGGTSVQHPHSPMGSDHDARDEDVTTPTPGSPPPMLATPTLPAPSAHLPSTAASSLSGGCQQPRSPGADATPPSAEAGSTPTAHASSRATERSGGVGVSGSPPFPADEGTAASSPVMSSVQPTSTSSPTLVTQPTTPMTNSAVPTANPSPALTPAQPTASPSPALTPAQPTASPSPALTPAQPTENPSPMQVSSQPTASPSPVITMVSGHKVTLESPVIQASAPVSPSPSLPESTKLHTHTHTPETSGSPHPPHMPHSLNVAEATSAERSGRSASLTQHPSHPQPDNTSRIRSKSLQKPRTPGAASSTRAPGAAAGARKFVASRETASSKGVTPAPPSPTANPLPLPRPHPKQSDDSVGGGSTTPSSDAEDQDTATTPFKTAEEAHARGETEGSIWVDQEYMNLRDSLREKRLALQNRLAQLEQRTKDRLLEERKRREDQKREERKLASRQASRESERISRLAALQNQQAIQQQQRMTPSTADGPSGLDGTQPSAECSSDAGMHANITGDTAPADSVSKSNCDGEDKPLAAELSAESVVPWDLQQRKERLAASRKTQSLQGRTQLMSRIANIEANIAQLQQKLHLTKDAVDKGDTHAALKVILPADHPQVVAQLATDSEVAAEAESPLRAPDDADSSRPPSSAAMSTVGTDAGSMRLLGLRSVTPRERKACRSAASRERKRATPVSRAMSATPSAATPVPGGSSSAHVGPRTEAIAPNTAESNKAQANSVADAPDTVDPRTAALDASVDANAVTTIPTTTSSAAGDDDEDGDDKASHTESSLDGAIPTAPGVESGEPSSVLADTDATRPGFAGVEGAERADTLKEDPRTASIEAAVSTAAAGDPLVEGNSSPADNPTDGLEVSSAIPGMAVSTDDVLDGDEESSCHGGDGDTIGIVEAAASSSIAGVMEPDADHEHSPQDPRTAAIEAHSTAADIGDSPSSTSEAEAPAPASYEVFDDEDEAQYDLTAEDHVTQGRHVQFQQTAAQFASDFLRDLFSEVVHDVALRSEASVPGPEGSFACGTENARSTGNRFAGRRGTAMVRLPANMDDDEDSADENDFGGLHPAARAFAGIVEVEGDESCPDEGHAVSGQCGPDAAAFGDSQSSIAAMLLADRVVEEAAEDAVSSVSRESSPRKTRPRPLDSAPQDQNSSNDANDVF
eukprot:Rmarinus@m.25226